MAMYEVYYRDPYGNLLEVFRQFERLEYARKENEIGVMNLRLPRSVPKSILRPDARMEIWRTVGAVTKLVGNTTWFLEDWEISSKYMELTAYDANWIIDGAIVDYNAGSTDASCAAEAADDAMKRILRHNLSTGTTTTVLVGLSPYLTIDADVTLAPTTTKDFSRRNCLKLLQELAQESREQGTYLSFDIEYVDAGQLTFKTYTNQRGFDHGRASGSPVILSERSKSLEDVSYIEKHGSEKTYVIAGGQGTEDTRMVERAQDDTRYYRSPFGMRKLWLDARMCSTSDSLLAEANAELEANQPEIKLTGRVVDTDGLRFGIHYDFGDIVVAEFEDISIDAHVDTIRVTVQDGFEQIDNRITGYL